MTKHLKVVKPSDILDIPLVHASHLQHRLQDIARTICTPLQNEVSLCITMYHHVSPCITNFDFDLATALVVLRVVFGCAHSFRLEMISQVFFFTAYANQPAALRGLGQWRFGHMHNWQRASGQTLFGGSPECGAGKRYASGEILRAGQGR